MDIGATYLCPVRGLSGLEPPEPSRLGRAAKAARDLGLNSLTLPVLEEALLSPGRTRVRYLDGMITALDRIGEAGLSAGILAPAQRLLGLDWIPPYLASARPDPEGRPAFLERRVRSIRPFAWWEDPLFFQRRIRLVRELLEVLSGHPTIRSWILLDGLLDWCPPDPQSADFFLRALGTEIRDRSLDGKITIRFRPSSLLSPDLLRHLSTQVDGLESACAEHGVGGVERPPGLAEEFTFAAFLGTLTQWLLERPAAVEVGWGGPGHGQDPERIHLAAVRIARQGLPGIRWISLVDPEPALFEKPPWSLRPALRHSGVLDQGLEPKENAELWVGLVRKTKPRSDPQGFLDIDPPAYFQDPALHFPRLWDHFREWS
jgi:hypothetical protein